MLDVIVLALAVVGIALSIGTIRRARLDPGQSGVAGMKQRLEGYFWLVFGLLIVWAVAGAARMPVALYVVVGIGFLVLLLIVKRSAPE